MLNAKVAVERAHNATEQTLLKLKQDVYKACKDYEMSLERYNASEHVAMNAGLAFEAADIRFQSGLINHFEYISVKEGYLKTKNEATALKYDVYFKMLVLDYYKTGVVQLNPN